MAEKSNPTLLRIMKFIRRYSLTRIVFFVVMPTSLTLMSYTGFIVNCEYEIYLEQQEASNSCSTLECKKGLVNRINQCRFLGPKVNSAWIEVRILDENNMNNWLSE